MARLPILGAVALLGLLALVPLYAGLTDQPFFVTFAARILVFALAALGLNLILGFGGIVSFGHAVFVGLGAYAVAIPVFYGLSDGWLHLALAIIVCALAGLVIGSVSLRTTGIGTIMITLAFGQMFYFLFVSLKPYGGDDGLPVATASRFAPGVDFANPATLYYAALAAVMLVLVASRLLVRARFGMVIRGCHTNERRMRALGFQTTRYKLAAYVLSAVICGVAGLFLGNLTGFASPSYLSWQTSGDLIVMIVLGGMGNVAGPMVGAVLYLLLEKLLQSWTDSWPAILGVLIVLAAILFQRGILGLGRPRRPARAS